MSHISLYGEGRLSRADYEQLIEQSERELTLWKTRASDKQKITVELTKVKELFGQTASLWHDSSELDKQGLAQTIFDYIVYDLDARQIVGYKLKGWAERYMTLRGALYEGYELEHYEGTNVTPTSEHPSHRYMASVYRFVVLILPHKSSSPRLDVPNFVSKISRIFHSAT